MNTLLLLTLLCGLHRTLADEGTYVDLDASSYQKLVHDSKDAWLILLNTNADEAEEKQKGLEDLAKGVNALEVCSYLLKGPGVPISPFVIMKSTQYIIHS